MCANGFHASLIAQSDTAIDANDTELWFLHWERERGKERMIAHEYMYGVHVRLHTHNFIIMMTLLLLYTWYSRSHTRRTLFIGPFIASLFADSRWIATKYSENRCLSLFVCYTYRSFIRNIFMRLIERRMTTASHNRDVCSIDAIEEKKVMLLLLEKRVYFFY